MKVWVAYSEPEYEMDFGVRVVGTSKEAVVRGLEETYEPHGVTVGPIQNDTVFDFVEMDIHPHNGEDGNGHREGATVHFYLLEFEVFK